MDTLIKKYEKEVKYGWQIPILPPVIKSIKGASVTPLGIINQWTINKENERILKSRVAHDCTFPGPSGLSINIRIDKELLEPCMYGQALNRYMHSMHYIRFRHPNKIILQSKTDLDAAFCQLHA